MTEINEPKFKLGDKVRVIAERECVFLDVGHEGIVLGLQEKDVSGLTVRVSGVDPSAYGQWCNPEDLDLVEDKEAGLAELPAAEPNWHAVAWKHDNIKEEALRLNNALKRRSAALESIERADIDIANSRESLATLRAELAELEGAK